jgi:sensor domain CHASE-containing protein
MEEETQENLSKPDEPQESQITKIWEKIKAIITRVAIVVFGVTVSISLQDMSAKRQERQDTKEFLIGLKEDLTQDIKEMEADKRSYAEKNITFNYFISVKKNQKVVWLNTLMPCFHLPN